MITASGGGVAEGVIDTAVTSTLAVAITGMVL